MSEHLSLADRAIQTLAAVKAMGADLDMSHPQRHAVRNLKHLAEQALATAFDQAFALSHQAQDLSELVATVRAEDAQLAQKLENSQL